MYINEINSNTKKAEQLLNNYYYAIKHYGCRTLDDCYEKPSERKRTIFQSLEHERFNDFYDSNSRTIVSFNSQFFTYAFTYRNDGFDYVHYVTYANEYDIPLNY